VRNGFVPGSRISTLVNSEAYQHMSDAMKTSREES